MKWFMVFLAFIGLVLGAASARAEPVYDWTFDVVEEAVIGGSWDDGFKLSKVTGARPVDWIQGKLVYDTFQATAFTAKADTGWYEVIRTDTLFAATGPAIGNPHPPEDLAFKLYGSSGPDAGPYPTLIKLHLQAYDGNDRQGNVTFASGWYQDSHDKWKMLGWEKTTGEWEQNAPIPEPFSMAFLGSALAGVVGLRLRKRRKEGAK